MRAAATLLLITTGVVLDLATKAWARSALEPYGPPTDFLPFVSLGLTFNEGVSFSLLASETDAARLLLIGLTGLLTLAVALWTYRLRGWQRLAFSVILAGALSNLIDRSARGAVTDFLGLHIGDWSAFMFNLADMWISLGCILLLTSRGLAERRKEKAA